MNKRAFIRFGDEIFNRQHIIYAYLESNPARNKHRINLQLNQPVGSMFGNAIILSGSIESKSHYFDFASETEAKEKLDQIEGRDSL